MLSQKKGLAGGGNAEEILSGFLSVSEKQKGVGGKEIATHRMGGYYLLIPVLSSYFYQTGKPLIKRGFYQVLPKCEDNKL